ncbi:hypothetical protein QJS10_CPA16g01719 [Acorus calamus]|uniref:Uncharacterized protein n=1 Tax=Acorus calamus TaxID=4465 RepID=A0AAV9CZZ9_ACOCL|nr:hypothetical protein QJS10_CPA16g01719 [Acorus calamus]
MGDHPQKTDEKHVGEDNGMGKVSTEEELVFSEADGDDSEGMKLISVDVIMKIGSLSIESKDDHTDRDALEEDVTVGTISVKVNGFEGKSS